MRVTETGSFSVTHCATRSPNRLPAAAQYSANRSAVDTVHPAAAVLEGQRRIPVVQGGHGGDAGGEQLVDQAVVEVQALRVEARRVPSGWIRGQEIEKR